MKVHVIKIALHTVGRIGFSAALFFLVGLYLVFPAATSFLAMQEDKKEDFEITATATKTVDLEELEGTKGVKKLSPVIKFNGKIAYGEYVWKQKLRGSWEPIWREKILTERFSLTGPICLISS